MSTYIYGAGSFAHRLKNSLISQGHSDITFLTRSDLSKAKTIGSGDSCYLGVFNHLDNPNEIIASLSTLGVKNVISPSQAIRELSDEDLNTYFLTSSTVDYATQDEISVVLDLLHDEESKTVLNGFIDYQVNGALTSLVRSGGHEIQYLGSTLPPDSGWFTGNLRWIDCGAFTGDTVEILVNNRIGKSDEFLCIEPEIQNYKKLVIKTNELVVQSINLNASVGESNGLISISGDGISAQSSSNLGGADYEGLVPEVTLNQIALSWNPTHIKMDIEGSEMKALVGGTDVLRKSRPNLAIAVYHRPRDIVEIPFFLKQILEDYTFFLRCYGAHGYDTLLYAISNQ